MNDSTYLLASNPNTSKGQHKCWPLLLHYLAYYRFMPANSLSMPLAAHMPQGMVKNLNPLST